MGNDPELILRLGLTIVLCFCIGLEREVHQKSAGLRTHTLVGLGAAIAMMISKYGFADFAGRGDVRLDPSRVASQVVTGVGFIGAGIIFVRRESVRGLTTAAVVWMSAMIGMAVGAGMYVLAVAGTAGHFFVMAGYPQITRRIPGSKWSPVSARVVYTDGQGVLRQLLSALTVAGFTVSGISTDRTEDRPGEVVVHLELLGKGAEAEVVAVIEQVPGVISTDAGPGVEAP